VRKCLEINRGWSSDEYISTKLDNTVPKPRLAQHTIGAKETALKLISVPRQKTKIGAELNLKYAPKER